jgi:putative hemolysin
VDIFWELLIIFVLILGNGFFAASEIAIVSARKGRLQQKAEEGDASAAAALALSEDPSRFLSTVQVGISLIGTFAAAFGGARMADRIVPLLTGWPLIAPYAETIALILVVLLITYLSLIFGELVPKRLALQAAESVATSVAPVMATIARFSAPVVSFLSFSTNLVLRLLGRGGSRDATVTEEDIMSMVREGTEGGSLDAAHQELIESVFTFTERSVRTIMTPRTEIVAIDVETPFEAALTLITESGYSRLPVYRDNLDNVLGLLFVKDLLRVWGQAPQADLETMLRPALFALDSQRVVEVFQQLKQGRSQVALVLDEYGQVAGLVTVEDILEELVGDINDEYDEAGEELVRREDGSYLVDGLMPFEELKDRLDLPELDEDLEDANFETVAGFFLALLGRIPTTGEQTSWRGFSFEVVDMDERRIDKLIVRPPA